jgi:hypothetical protein
LSVNGGSTWTALGSGARLNGGWGVTGLSLPANGSIRARGRATAGHENGSSSLIEQVASYSFGPVLSAPTWLPDRQLQLTLTGARGSNYVIQANTNLARSSWMPLITNLAPFTYTDPNASNYPQRLYRAVTQ